MKVKEVLNKKTHRPLIWICVAYGMGIAMSSWISVPINILCFVIVGLLLINLFLGEGWIGSVVLLILFICVGNLQVQAVRILEKKDITYVARFYRGKNVQLKGKIVSDVQVKNFFKGKKRVFQLDVQSIQTQWGWKKCSGKILVNLFKKAEIVYGDIIVIEGKLHQPYNFSQETHFSYQDYLKNKGMNFILSVSKKAIVKVIEKNQGNKIKALSFRIRQKLKLVLAENLTLNEAGVMQAILLGDRTHIPKQVRELFVQTGTAHILAISGLHVGVVAAIFMVFFRLIPIGRQAQLLSVIILLMGYAFLTGGRPSVVRATLVAVVFILSFIIERETDSLNTLSLAALIILLANPLNFFDVGFQLSFTCVLVIILFQPYLNQIKIGLISSKNHTNVFLMYIQQSLNVSISAWLGAAGLVAYYFNIITPITILANLIVIPLISVIVVLGFGLLFAGLMSSQISILFAMCLKVTLNIMTGIIFLLAKIPYAYFQLSSITIGQVAVYYGVLLLVYFLQKSKWKLGSMFFDKV